MPSPLSATTAKERGVQRVGVVKNRDCYMELFKYLVKNNLDYTVNSNGAFSTSPH